MAVTHSRSSIRLTGREAKSFSEKMKNPDCSVMRKKDAFIKQSRRSINIVHKPNGGIILKAK